MVHLLNINSKISHKNDISEANNVKNSFALFWFSFFFYYTIGP